MRGFARTVKLVNDVAERGVKMADDYSNCLTNDSEERKKLVMVVQNHRRAYPKLRKMDLKKRFGDIESKESEPEVRDEADVADVEEETVEVLEDDKWSDADSDNGDY